MKRALVFLLFSTLACRSEPAGLSPETDALAFGVTDLREYVLPNSRRERVTIRFVYSNWTHDTVWIVRCREPIPELQKLVEGEWVRAGAGVIPDCLSAFSVQPGARLRSELRIARVAKPSLDALP